MSGVELARQLLRGLRQADGGFGPSPGADSEPEPTALAAIGFHDGSDERDDMFADVPDICTLIHCEAVSQLHERRRRTRFRRRLPDVCVRVGQAYLAPDVAWWAVGREPWAVACTAWAKDLRELNAGCGASATDREPVVPVVRQRVHHDHTRWSDLGQW